MIHLGFDALWSYQCGFACVGPSTELWIYSPPTIFCFLLKIHRLITYNLHSHCFQFTLVSAKLFSVVMPIYVNHHRWQQLDILICCLRFFHMVIKPYKVTKVHNITSFKQIIESPQHNPVANHHNAFFLVKRLKWIFSYKGRWWDPDVG